MSVDGFASLCVVYFINFATVSKHNVLDLYIDDLSWSDSALNNAEDALNDS